MFSYFFISTKILTSSGSFFGNLSRIHICHWHKQTPFIILVKISLIYFPQFLFTFTIMPLNISPFQVPFIYLNIRYMSIKPFQPFSPRYKQKWFGLFQHLFWPLSINRGAAVEYVSIKLIVDSKNFWQLSQWLCRCIGTCGLSQTSFCGHIYMNSYVQNGQAFFLNFTLFPYRIIQWCW